MIRSLTILFVLTLVIACNEKATPELELSDEKTIALIQDLHIANSILQKYRTHEKDSISQILRNQLASIHHLSVERIDYVMEQVQLHPKEYFDFEKEAVENLKILKDSLKTEPIKKSSSDRKK